MQQSQKCPASFSEVSFSQEAECAEEAAYLRLSDLALFIRKMNSGRGGWWCSWYFLLSLPEYEKRMCDSEEHLL